jgi:hypothetical protein
MVKCCVFFEVRTEFLNTAIKSFGLKGLKAKAIPQHTYGGAGGEEV